MGNKIRDRQNNASALELLAAQRKLYSRAKIFRLLRFVGAVLLVLVGAVVSVRSPAAGAYVAAAAAIWCFLVSAFLTPLERHEQKRGAAVQERFDRAVFAFDAADARLGVIDEDIVSLSRGADRGPLKDWYEMDDRVPESLAVLLAQRSNLAWDGKQRVAYAWFALLGAVLVVVGGTTLAFARDLLLKEALLLVVCPSLPALAHAVDVWRDHRSAAREKESLIEEIEKLWLRVKERPDSLSQFRLAAIQSEIHRMRAEHVPVPDLVHRLMKDVLHETAKGALARRLTELNLP